MSFSIDSALKIFDIIPTFMEVRRKNGEDRTDKINDAMDKLSTFDPQHTLANADCETIIEAIMEFQRFARKDYLSNLSNPQLKTLVLEFWNLYDDTKQYVKKIQTDEAEKKRDDLVCCYSDLYNSLDKLLDTELKVWRRLCSCRRAKRSKPIVAYTKSSWFLSFSAKTA